MTVRLQLVRQLKPVEAEIDVDRLDARTHADRGPRTVLGAPTFTVTVREWPQFVALMQAVAPDLTEAQLREMVEAQTSGLVAQIVGRK